MPRTRLSSKGQVVLPKEVRERHGWRAGTEIEVEDQGEVVVLRPVTPKIRPTTLEELRGCLKYDGPPIPEERWHEGIDQMMREMWEEFEKQSR